MVKGLARGLAERIESIGIIFAISLQIGIMVWSVSEMKTSIDFNKEQLKDLNTKLERHFHEFEKRIRENEKEISVLKIIIDSKNH